MFAVCLKCLIRVLEKSGVLGVKSSESNGQNEWRLELLSHPFELGHHRADIVVPVQCPGQKLANLQPWPPEKGQNLWQKIWLKRYIKILLVIHDIQARMSIFCYLQYHSRHLHLIILHLSLPKRTINLSCFSLSLDLAELSLDLDGRLDFTDIAQFRDIL